MFPRFNCIICLLVLLFCSLLSSSVPAQERGAIGEYRSRNFLLRTDLDKDESAELLNRLETMLDLISRYWGKKNAGLIEIYVFENTANWSQDTIPPQAWDSVTSGGGLTMTQKRTIGNVWQAKAIVYAIADRGTPQHEAVHAYCAQAFGSTGPVWYSEGMAEVGKYWQDPKDKSVTCDPYVIEYLKSVERKPLKEIVDLNQFTGDSWQNYSWRWTLCHLLGFNENYSQRFKPLGLALMTEVPNVTFWTVYGSMAKEIEFEHKLFVQNLCVGYRVDLCSWDWKTKFTPARGSRTVSSKIEANEGWQASRLEVEEGQTYSVSTTGDWTIEADGEPLSAAGDDEGNGRLIGVLFNDYELSEPFDLGSEETFTARGDGQLYVRCQDDWGQLADNEGSISLRLQLMRSE